jgi:flavin reductase (DIM6/NTAB) family NADH-FMN oxidoreductase RutF
VVSDTDELFRPAPDQIERLPGSAATRLMLGGPVALVTSRWRGQANVMPIAWHTPVSSQPPLVAIAVEHSRFTAEMISHAQEFALNFPTRPLLHHVQYLGALSGEHIDKFEATQLETFSPEKITAPLLSACSAWIECEVVEVIPLGDHILFVGLVVAVQADPDVAGEDGWVLHTHEEEKPLHFLGGNRYSSLHRLLEARMPLDHEAPERVLAERMAEELELTRDARERREERLEALRREVQRGNIVDVSELDSDLDDDALDLSQGIVIDGGESNPRSEPK